MEKKYYCKQVEPEFADDGLFYQVKTKDGRYELRIDDDGINEDIIIFGNSDYMEYWPDGLEKITTNLTYFSNDYDGWYGGHESITELANYYFKKHNGKRWSKVELHKWKEVAEAIQISYELDEALLLALKLITGKTWRKDEMRGCMQREWQDIYVSDIVSDEEIHYIEMCYFGTGEEFRVYESKEDFDNDENDFSIYVDGFNVKHNIAQAIGCEEDELDVYEINGYTREPKYELI